MYVPTYYQFHHHLSNYPGCILSSYLSAQHLLIHIINYHTNSEPDSENEQKYPVATFQR